MVASEQIPRVQWISWVKDADSCQVCDWIMKRNIGGGMTPEGYWYHENDSVDSKEYPKRSICANLMQFWISNYKALETKVVG